MAAVVAAVGVKMQAGVIVGVLVGMALGIGGYTFFYAHGTSYLKDDPAACANCHVMHEQHDGWIKSSHRQAATCNDCHVPATWPANWTSKASNGFWHSFAFTTGRFPETIRIKPHNLAIVEESCRACHASIVQAMDAGPHGQDAVSCTRCHASVGHL